MKIPAPKISLYAEVRYFDSHFPDWGGRKASGARLSSKEITAAHKTLASIDISPDIANRLIEAQKQTFALLNTPKERQRQPRYYLKQLIDWSVKNEFFPSTKLPEEKPQYIFYPHKINRIKKTNRGKNHKFSFSFEVYNYANELLPPEQIQQHLQRINQEVTNFKKHKLLPKVIGELLPRTMKRI